MIENTEYPRDLVNELLTTHPSEPVTSGVVLLLRAELKSEIKSLRMEMNQRFDLLTGEVTGMKSEVVGLKSEVVGLKSEVVGLKSEVAELKTGFLKLNDSLELIASNVALLLNRSN